MTGLDAETDPGRQTPARKRLVGRRWFVGALVFGAATVPANLFGLDELSFLLMLASMMCLTSWSRDMGWVRGFEAGRRAPGDERCLR